MKLSEIYTNNCFWVIAYYDGHGSVELLDRVFVGQNSAIAYAKREAKNYSNGKLRVQMVSFDNLNTFFEISEE